MILISNAIVITTYYLAYSLKLKSSPKNNTSKKSYDAF